MIDLSTETLNERRRIASKLFVRHLIKTVRTKYGRGYEYVVWWCAKLDLDGQMNDQAFYNYTKRTQELLGNAARDHCTQRQTHSCWDPRESAKESAMFEMETYQQRVMKRLGIKE